VLAAGETLDSATLLRAYRRGIFPWFSQGQPVLWWSPDPRMVLWTADFKLHVSLRKAIRAGLRAARLEIRIDAGFERVMRTCAQTPRAGQDGTWIVEEMVQAYTALHRLGHAHAVETWWDGEPVGGLYCVQIGGMVYGESMYSHRPNASKMALAALVALCRVRGWDLIDCQQHTAHLATLGGRTVPRSDFCAAVAQRIGQQGGTWDFHPVYWNQVLNSAIPEAHT
jgi:leucyl/phenylalanyl-tRNA--protein transferase